MRTCSITIAIGMMAPLLCTPCLADNRLTTEYHDTVWDYKALFLHDAITVDDSHLIDKESEWKFWGGLIEISGAPFGDDALAYGLSRYHKIAPHDESPSDILTDAMLFLPGDFPDNDYVRLEAKDGVYVMPHGAHFDIHAFLGYVRIGHFLGMDDIGAYTLLFVGEHTDNANATISIDAQSVKDSLNHSDDDSFGSTSMFIDSSSGYCKVAMAINGQPLDTLMRVTLNLGAPGQQGPVILDLGGPQDWSDLDGSISRDATGYFPLEHMQSLRNGLVYVQVTNLANPQGSIRGQLNRSQYQVLANQIAVTKGQVTSGGLAAIQNPEDTRMGLLAEAAQIGKETPIEFSVKGWSLPRNPASMTLRLEGSASSNLFQQTIALYDFQAQKYQNVDQRPTTTTESRADIVVQNPARFIGPDGTVDAKVSYTPTSSGRRLKLRANVDWIQWSMSP